MPFGEIMGNREVCNVATQDCLDNFNINLVAGRDRVHGANIKRDLHRPGVDMTVHITFYPRERLQLIGRTEMAYFLALSAEEKKDRAERLCTDITPGIVISRGMEIPDELLDAANRSGVPILRSPRKTTRVISRLTNYLEMKFAPFTAVHGVLVDVYGVGVLIIGESGVGKSETALEL